MFTTEIMIGVVSSVVATGLLAFLVAGYRRARERGPFARVLNFARTERVVFVFPSRPDAPGHQGLLRDIRVAFEDMLAVSYV